MKRYLNQLNIKTTRIIITVIYICMLIPMYIIAYYNWPSADDYSMGMAAYNAWNQTHNILNVLWQGIYMAGYDWIHWTGFYTCTFFMSIPFNAFGSECYFIGTLISLTVFHIALYYMLNCIFIRLLKIDKDTSGILSIIIIFMCVQCLMPDARMEMFYWYCSAGGYTLTYSLGFIYIGMLATILSADPVKKGYIVLTCVIAALAGGSNYLTALELALISVTMIILAYLLPEWRSHKAALIPAITYLIGFFLNISAPGNLQRATKTDGLNPVSAVVVSFYNTINYAFSDWTTWVILALWLMTLPLWWKCVQRINLTFRYPILVTLYGYCLISATVTPPLYGVGNIESGRLSGQFYMQYIIIFTLVIGYWVGWFRMNHMNANAQVADGRDRSSSVFTRYYIVLAVFMIFASALCIKTDPHYYAFTSAITDLANGHAAQYRSENVAREKILLDDSVTDVVLDAYSVEPQLLYYIDLSTYEGDWINLSMDHYYGKNSIVKAAPESDED